MASSRFAVIAGAGAGTGAAIARRFAQKYPVFLLARTPESYSTTVQEITSNGGQAFGIPADVSSRNDVRRAFDKIEQKIGKDASCAVSLSTTSWTLHRLIVCAGGRIQRQCSSGMEAIHGSDGGRI